MASCDCLELSTNLNLRIDEWRKICEQFFYHKDPKAKQILEYFEICKLDQIILQTNEDTKDVDVDAQIKYLGLCKCMIPDHGKYFDTTMEQYEIAKNGIRSAYHEYIAQQKYDKFQRMVKEKQGQNYQIPLELENQNCMVLVREYPQSYLRSYDQSQRQLDRTKLFLKTYVREVGVYPFLAGIKEMLLWNLSSSTVVGWTVHDSVFIETAGPEFPKEAIIFLTETLGCGHVRCNSTNDTTVPMTNNRGTDRTWYLDPYVSDTQIEKLLRVFSDYDQRIHSNITGTQGYHRIDQLPIQRLNRDGQFDEKPSFFTRFCIIL